MDDRLHRECCGLQVTRGVTFLGSIVALETDHEQAGVHELDRRWLLHDITIDEADHTWVTSVPDRLATFAALAGQWQGSGGELIETVRVLARSR